MSLSDLARREAGAALVEALDAVSAALPGAVELARHEGRAAERAAVVAWLRERHADTQEWDGYDNATSRAYDRAADAIEDGEHRREETK